MNIMTKRGSEDNIVTYEHYCDTKADLANIPQDQISLGSVAIVLKDEDDSMGIYLANSNKEWISFSTGGGGDGGTSEDTNKNDIPREMENEILAGTISVYTNPTASVVNPGTFGYRSTLTYVEMPKCTTIGAVAFQSCSNLQAVSFPECKNIGIYAFQSCTSLSEVYFPECVSIADACAFMNTALTKVDFPKCTFIGVGTFSECSKLSEVSFPMVETIGAVAFEKTAITSAYFPRCTTISGPIFNNCSLLTDVDFPALTSAVYLGNAPVENVKMNALLTITSGNFAGFSSTLRTGEFAECVMIGSNAFASYSNLQMVSLPNCISVSNFGFYSTGLTTISMSKCKTIGAQAFKDCKSLFEVYFPECETIGGAAFMNCDSLTSVYFPSVVSIDGPAFEDCNLLTDIDFPALTSYIFQFNNSPITHARMNALSIIPSSAFYYFSSTFETGEFAECKTIGSHAFAFCSKLQTVSFPKCEIVHSNAFYSCESLQYINMPECKTLGTGLTAFGYCSSLSYISFPKCEIIQSNCFAYCTALQSAYFLTSSIPTMQSTDTFYNTPISYADSGRIYVKASLASAFKTATNWSAYSSKIVGLTDEEIAALDANN